MYACLQHSSSILDVPTINRSEILHICRRWHSHNDNSTTPCHYNYTSLSYDVPCQTSSCLENLKCTHCTLIHMVGGYTYFENWEKTFFYWEIVHFEMTVIENWDRPKLKKWEMRNWLYFQWELRNAHSIDNWEMAFLRIKLGKSAFYILNICYFFVWVGLSRFMAMCQDLDFSNPNFVTMPEWPHQLQPCKVAQLHKAVVPTLNFMCM